MQPVLNPEDAVSSAALTHMIERLLIAKALGVLMVSVDVARATSETSTFVYYAFAGLKFVRKARRPSEDGANDGKMNGFWECKEVLAHVAHLLQTRALVEGAHDECSERVKAKTLLAIVGELWGCSKDLQKAPQAADHKDKRRLDMPMLPRDTAHCLRELIVDMGAVGMRNFMLNRTPLFGPRLSSEPSTRDSDEYTGALAQALLARHDQDGLVFFDANAVADPTGVGIARQVDVEHGGIQNSGRAVYRLTTPSLNYSTRQHLLSSSPFEILVSLRREGVSPAMRHTLLEVLPRLNRYRQRIFGVVLAALCNPAGWVTRLCDAKLKGTCAFPGTSVELLNEVVRSFLKAELTTWASDAWVRREVERCDLIEPLAWRRLCAVLSIGAIPRHRIDHLSQLEDLGAAECSNTAEMRTFVDAVARARRHVDSHVRQCRSVINRARSCLDDLGVTLLSP